MTEYWKQKLPLDYGKFNAELKSNDDTVVKKGLENLTYYSNLPLITQKLILGLTSSNEVDVVNMAVICVRKCKDMKMESRDVLLNTIVSEHWFIRANSAESMAELGINDVESINAICTLLGDQFGNDFNPHESAITALGIIGSPAKRAVPQLIYWCEKEIDSDNRNKHWVDMPLECISRIDSLNQKFYRLLIKTFYKLDMDFNTNIIRYLSAFGGSVSEIIPFLQPYVNLNEFLEDEYLTDRSAESVLLNALYSIEGMESPSLKKYIQNLKNSPHKEWREYASSYEKQLGLN